MKSDYLGGIVIFVIMFSISAIQIYLFKNVRVFSACACAGGNCVGQCGGRGGRGGSGACACTNGHCVGDCDGDGDGGGGYGNGGNGDKRRRRRRRGGKGKGRDRNREGGGGSSTTPPAPRTPAPAPAPTTATPGCDCSCMPMDSDPSRFKIETPEGEDCYNHVYPDTMEECQAALVGVCASRGGKKANLASRIARLSRIIIA